MTTTLLMNWSRTTMENLMIRWRLTRIMTSTMKPRKSWTSSISTVSRCRPVSKKLVMSSKTKLTTYKRSASSSNTIVSKWPRTSSPKSISESQQRTRGDSSACRTKLRSRHRGAQRPIPHTNAPSFPLRNLVHLPMLSSKSTTRTIKYSNRVRSRGARWPRWAGSGMRSTSVSSARSDLRRTSTSNSPSSYQQRPFAPLKTMLPSVEAR